MINYQVLKGSTNVSVTIRILDDTDGTPETGVVWNTSGIDMEYRRETAAVVDITEATLAALTTAHTDGGFLHIGNGYYRLDVPDAAFATGVTGVLIQGTVTGMVVIGCYVHLVDVDDQDAVRMGMTALPNAAADAAGGLPISDAGGLDLDGNVAAALVAIGLDHLLGASVAGSDVTDDSIIAQLVSASATADWDDFDNTTEALQALRDRGDAAWTTGSGTGLTALATGTAQGGSSSTIQLASGESFADDELNGNVVKVTGGTGAGQARVITDYVGATDTATVSPAWITNPDATSTYEVVEGSANVTVVGGSAEDIATATALAALNDLSAADVNTQCDTAISDAALATAAAIAALNDLSAAQVNTECDTAISDAALATAAAIAALNDLSAADVNAQCDTAISDASLATAAAIAALNDLSAAQVNSECDTAISDASLATAAAIAALNDIAASDVTTDVFAQAIENSLTFLQVMRLLGSSQGGKTSGMASTNAKIRSLADDKDRVDATVDVDGNRTAVTLDVTA